MLVTSGFSLTLAACLLLFLWSPVFHKPSLADLVGASYQFAATLNLGPEQVKARMDPLPWERRRSGYGFSPSKPVSMAARAFGAGLWSGRRELEEEKDLRLLPEFLSPDQQAPLPDQAKGWSLSPWVDYFEMGRWCMLVRALCLNDAEVPLQFWKQQAPILDRLQDKVLSPEEIGEEARIAHTALSRIRSAIEDLDPDIGPRRRCKTVAAEVELLMEILSPGAE
jgi:hypothetical protein